jgi:hypothetical protein
VWRSLFSAGDCLTLRSPAANNNAGQDNIVIRPEIRVGINGFYHSFENVMEAFATHWAQKTTVIL